MDQAIAFDRAWGRRLRRLSPRDWRRWRDLAAGLPLKALAGVSPLGSLPDTLAEGEVILLPPPLTPWMPSPSLHTRWWSNSPPHPEAMLFQNGDRGGPWIARPGASSAPPETRPPSKTGTPAGQNNEPAGLARVRPSFVQTPKRMQGATPIPANARPSG
jgi:hypothetical protein